MLNDETQSIKSALLNDDRQHFNNGDLNRPVSSAIGKPTNNSMKQMLRNNISSTSFRRYRSSSRRNVISNESNISECASTPSFPLFRRFYLMRNSIKRKRNRNSSNNIPNSFTVASSEKLYPSPRIRACHALTTIFITLISACLLILMIFVDMAYLNDVDSYSMNYVVNSTTVKNIPPICRRHPKVCVMKGLVITVFICITVSLCYTILALYTRARRHSRLLERKTDELEKEKSLTEKLLHEILPPCVAKDLINGRKAPAEYYESVTVYFSDIVGFTIIAR